MPTNLREKATNFSNATRALALLGVCSLGCSANGSAANTQNGGAPSNGSGGASIAGGSRAVTAGSAGVGTEGGRTAGGANSGGSNEVGGASGFSGATAGGMNVGGVVVGGGGGGAPTRMGPRILIALHGSNALANNADWDNQWTYVRAHLDGYWGNNAGISAQEEAALWKKISGRTLFTEWDSVDKAAFVSPNQFTGAEQYMPGITINREQICLYADPASLWNGNRVADAKANYVDDAAVQAAHRFKNVCTGFQPFAPGALTGAALSAFKDSAATFIEYPAAAWTQGAQKDNFVSDWKATHAKGGAFVWFDSIYAATTIHEWFTSTQAAYTDIASMGLIQPQDVIVLINYSGRLPSVPESANGQAAESTTGIAYWLLHQ